MRELARRILAIQQWLLGLYAQGFAIGLNVGRKRRVILDLDTLTTTSLVLAGLGHGVELSNLVL